MANKNTKVKVAGAAGVLAAGAAAAAAGYYFYAAKDAKSNRKIAAKWAGNLKNDVVKQAKKVQKLDKKAVLSIIDTAAAAYETARNVDKNDLQRAAKELKNNWQALTTELGMGASTPKKTVKKTKTGTTKKTVTKSKAKKAAPKAR